jgi:Ca2+/Na+ antiporter
VAVVVASRAPKTSVYGISLLLFCYKLINKIALFLIPRNTLLSSLFLYFYIYTVYIFKYISLHSKREQRKFPAHIRPNSSPLPSIPTLPSVLFFFLISHALAQTFLKNNRKSAGFHPETSQIGHFSV